MSLVDSLRRRPLLVMAALGVGLGTVLGLLHPIAPDSAERAGSDLPWSLPPVSVVPRFNDKQFAAVNSRRIWGTTDAGPAEGRVGADGKPALPWRLTGIILEPVPIALVLAEGSLSVGRVAVGELLPDGDLLLSVAATGIAYQHEGCTLERRLYGDPEQKPEPVCEAQLVAPSPEADEAEAQ
ncbi:MAG: hypothetical protein CVV12_00070 [Gammaproteobacteria bacterium HGW-Gammaproteobacteria-2]|nr:MAG: hypothetical protein CVV12_00070 [Gammaproteobacteria bacterium HGW-Gammaproteobacteria-2]